MPVLPSAPPRWQRWLPLALVATVVLAYSPSLGGGFLNYDDRWLIADNPWLGHRQPHALRAIWTDLGYSTRMALGAEYLPLRDMSHWLELALPGGPHPQLMRAVQLAMYLGAVLLFRCALLRCCRDPWVAELGAWLFALHPVHSESVAWLAGRKDVLALLFIGGALAVHAGTSRHRLWAVPVLLTAACLSKSMSVAALALLPAIDLLAWRRPDWRVLVLSAVPCVQLAALASHVGTVVGMTVGPWGGSRSNAAATMGPIWLRYIGETLWPTQLSVVHDVPVRTGWDVLAVAGWCTVAAWAVLAGLMLLRRRPLLAASWLWFVAPLAPVSHVLFSLENRMADRYLFLSVMGPALLAAAGLHRAARRRRSALTVGGVAVLALAAVTAGRARAFSDSVRLFQDATRKTAVNGIAPYQLGKALEESGREDQAESAFREAVARAQPPRIIGRSAIAALTQLLARRNKLDESEALLRYAARSWPPDPVIMGNLAEVLARKGRTDEARALFRDVMRRFPDYVWARERARARFGEQGGAPSGGTTVDP